MQLHEKNPLSFLDDFRLVGPFWRESCYFYFDFWSFQIFEKVLTLDRSDQKKFEANLHRGDLFSLRKKVQLDNWNQPQALAEWGAPAVDDWGAPAVDDWGAPAVDDWA